MIEAVINPSESKEKGGKKRSKTKRVSGKLKGALLSLAKKCVASISEGQGHVWGYDGKRYPYYPGGYSRAQYAVLGLRSARLLKLKVPKDVWKDM